LSDNSDTNGAPFRSSRSGQPHRPEIAIEDELKRSYLDYA